jgi:GNAT superfamily N-acetyltransferase
MWVDPAARGLGIGRSLLSALEGAAAELGCHTVRLDTAAYLTEALPLYRSAGYSDIPAYNDNPYSAHWLEKRLR